MHNQSRLATRCVKCFRLNAAFFLAFLATSGAFAATALTQADVDATKVYYKITYTGSFPYRQVFLDTDQTIGTGYNQAGIGADYMIQNGDLFQHDGEGNGWNWKTPPKPITFSDVPNNDGTGTRTASWSFLKSDIGSPATISLFAQTSNGSTASASGKQIQVLKSTVNLTTPQTDATYFYFQASFTGNPPYKQLYLDTDQNTKTGWNSNGIGADYMIENDQLHKYTGTGTDWKWSPAISNINVNFVLNAGTFSWKISSKDLGSPAQVNLYVNVQFPQGLTTKTSLRNPLVQPFSEASIWNRPIGTKATYAASKLAKQYTDPYVPADDRYWADFPQVESERLILSPTSPQIPIYVNKVGWTKNPDGSMGDRCLKDTSGDKVISYDVAFPSDYFVENSTKNNAAAILGADQHTLAQVQPLARCANNLYIDANGKHYATALPGNEPSDIYGNYLVTGTDGKLHPLDVNDGQYGRHGGSALSSIGGTIRLGEMRPWQETGPKHALKIVVDTYYSFAKCTSDCFVWPARGADLNASSYYGKPRYPTNPDPQTGPAPEMKMGVLLAIPSTVNIKNIGLKTTPGYQLAWTLQNYGAYVVDGRDKAGFNIALEENASDSNCTNTPTGPKCEQCAASAYGSKCKEFKDDYTFDFAQRYGIPNDWTKDLYIILQNLSVVTNSYANQTASGGGDPLQPLAPALHPRF